MIAKIVYYCNLLRWFIIGGKKPVRIEKKDKAQERKRTNSNWSKAEYQMHFRNVASNLGLLHEAREWWNEQPMEYRIKKQEQWKKRYGPNWRKHVVI